MEKLEKIKTSMDYPRFRYDTDRKINEIIDALDVITAQVKSVRDGWTGVEIKKAEVKPWPQYNDTVFAISSQLHINEHRWIGSGKDKTKLAIGMIQPTREEAEAKVQAIIGLTE
jgi:hypothetical protein